MTDTPDSSPELDDHETHPEEDSLKAFLVQLEEDACALSSFAHVIIAEARRSLSRPNGEGHSNHLLENALRLSACPPGVPLSIVEKFVLVASAYLHDLPKSLGPEAEPHGVLAWYMIKNSPAYDCLFPTQNLGDAVADVCRVHCIRLEAIKDLRANVDCNPLNEGFGMPRKADVHIQRLAALFRMADECDCCSERFHDALGLSASDPRRCISEVHVDPEENQIRVELRNGVDTRARLKCEKHMENGLAKVRHYVWEDGGPELLFFPQARVCAAVDHAVSEHDDSGSQPDGEPPSCEEGASEHPPDRTSVTPQELRICGRILSHEDPSGVLNDLRRLSNA